MTIPLIFFGAAFIIVVGALLFTRIENKRKLRALIGMKLLLVRLPRASSEGKDLIEEINFSEQFFS
jgi:hypothetical protein